MVYARTASVVLLAAGLAGAPCVLAAPPTTNGSSQPVYKWTDESGGIHYGDVVPPQYADQERTLLNPQGIAIGKIPGRLTPEQLAADAEQRAANERRQREAVQSRQRDQNLLATYLTVEEIQSLRDRRTDILDGQARVTVAYLDQLRAKQLQLEEQARHFKPYTATAVGPIPEHLAEDLVRVAADISTQERNLATKQQELAALKEQFESDIARFRELKKSAQDYARERAQFPGAAPQP
jgi:hypothetical protein